MNIYITAHVMTYRRCFEDLVTRCDKEFPEARIRVLFGQERPAGGVQANHERFLLPQGFQKSLNFKIDTDATLRRSANFADRIPLDLHRSDLRFVVRQRTEAMLALEQAVFAEAIEAQFAEAKPDLVFVPSGTNILHSVSYYLSIASGAKTYRIHSFLNLDRDIGRQRVWFCSNNRTALSNRPEDRFGYDEDAVRAHIASLHEAIDGRMFKRDMLSRRFRPRRMPVTLRQFTTDVGRVIYSSLPLHRRGKLGRLSSNINRDRLRVLVNGWRNDRVVVPVGQLSKTYILFVLNTSYDSQILIRAPEYRDFPSLIELVAGMMPYGYDLALREHPAFPGMLDHGRLVSLQRRHPHVKLVSSEVPLPDVMAGARGVLIINNTAFIDAILAGKPVISLADGYFTGTGLTREVSHPRDLRIALGELVRGMLDGDRRAQLVHIMSMLFQETFPGLDVRYDDKVETINDGIVTKMRRIREMHGSFARFCEVLRSRHESG